MKRAAARRLIERYFYQLTDGCGNPSCDNEYCASSGEVKNLTPNQAAAQALQLFSQEARLCDRHPNKMARTHTNSTVSNDNNKTDNTERLLIEPQQATTCFNITTKDPCDLDNNSVINNKTETFVSKHTGKIFFTYFLALQGLKVV